MQNEINKKNENKMKINIYLPIDQKSKTKHIKKLKSCENATTKLKLKIDTLVKMD